MPKDTSETPTLQEHLVRIYEDGEALIGKAFTEDLLPSLPRHLAILEAFSALPEVAAGELAVVSLNLSVGASGDPGAYLARRGITPVHVAEARMALDSLADRKRGEDPSVTIALRLGGEAAIWRSEADREVTLVTGLPPASGKALTGWALDVAGHRPDLFEHFASTREGDRLVLTWNGRD